MSTIACMYSFHNGLDFEQYSTSNVFIFHIAIVSPPPLFFFFFLVGGGGGAEVFSIKEGNALCILVLRG